MKKKIVLIISLLGYMPMFAGATAPAVSSCQANITHVPSKQEFIYAIPHGDKKTVSAYLCVNSDVDWVDNKGTSPLGVAAMFYSKEIFDMILDKAKNLEMKSAMTHSTPLLNAAANADHEKGLYYVTSLLQKGADIHAKRIFNDNVLMAAALEGNRDLVQYLLNGKQININEQNNDGHTALYMSLRALCDPEKNKKQIIEITKMLLKNGANIEHQDALGYTPLLSAVMWNCPDAVLLFLDHGASINAVGTKPTLPYSPLMFAARNANFAMVKLLLRKGADATVKNRNNETALDVAKRKFAREKDLNIRYHYQKIIDYLLPLKLSPIQEGNEE